jgi:nuclear GTP-binding protein
MAKPKLKKESKRMSCRKKYKIQKKVREHNRKVRKEEKLNANKKKSKDPGIPNLYPFKEHLLKQIQEKKEKEDDEKAKRKEQKQKQASRKRKLQDLQRDAEKRAKQFEKKQENESSALKASEFSIRPLEDSKRMYYKEFKKVVEASDVVIEVLDARDPMGCRCPQIEEHIMGYGKKKKLVLLLNKIDLVPKENAEKWLKYLRDEHPAILFKASTQTQSNKLAQTKVSVSKASEDLLKTSNCIGDGIVLASGSSDIQIILRNAVKIETLDDPVKPVESILSRCNKIQVMEKYCVADYSNTLEFLSMFAKRLGKLKKGGIPDILAAAKIILQDWNSGKISFYTHPPERKGSDHDSAEVMQYFGAEFDLKALEQEEKDDLDGLLSAMESALVLGPGKPTSMEEESIVNEEIDDDDVENDIEHEEEDKMVDSDDEGNYEDAVIQMVVKKKSDITGADEHKKVKNNLSDDVTNKQVNQDRKKAFKSQQKEERKKLARLVASEIVETKEDADPSARREKDVNNVPGDMVDSDDDSYNFDDVLSK